MERDELELQAELEDTHFWYRARRRQVLKRIPQAKPGQVAIDLGAGSGGNTSILAERGYAPIALEYHPVAAGVVAGRGHTVVRGDAHRLPFPDASIDLVMACDVFEHLTDDVLAMREVRRVLKPTGQLVLTVPADPTLWSTHDVALSHLRRYTRQSLSIALKTAGFQTSEMSSWMVLMRPAVAWKRRGHSAPPPNTTQASPDDEWVSDLEPAGKVMNAVASAILRLEEWLPVRGRRGVTLVSVAAPWTLSTTPEAAGELVPAQRDKLSSTLAS